MAFDCYAPLSVLRLASYPENGKNALSPFDVAKIVGSAERFPPSHLRNMLIGNELRNY